MKPVIVARLEERKAGSMLDRLVPGKVAAVLAGLAGLPWLAACSDFPRLSSEEALIETTASKGHPIAFVAKDEYLDIEVPPNGLGLSRNQYVDVYRFALRFQTEGEGTLTMALPAHSQRAAGDIRRAVREAGLSSPHLARSGRSRGHVITLAYKRPIAVAPHCGHWYKDAGRDGDRVPYPDFGCSTQKNLANMVVNSRDLLTSQEETPAASERRVRIWSKYVMGDVAAAQTPTVADAPDGKAKAGKK